ncbi:hypothetical protein L2E82_20833 [Cichorium intybus]|uniref:Uncharacterized protein n=1 Tax=Cichorium intybus TaxID=13427 RepID=A0ACB9DU05_CICIN|nr:hypothetical protein L2E82_20833 [Cichorium intybus]
MSFFHTPLLPHVILLSEGFGLQVQKPEKARDGIVISLALKPFVRFDVCKRPSIFSSPSLLLSELGDDQNSYIQQMKTLGPSVMDSRHFFPSRLATKALTRYNKKEGHVSWIAKLESSQTELKNLLHEVDDRQKELKSMTEKAIKDMETLKEEIQGMLKLWLGFTRILKEGLYSGDPAEKHEMSSLLFVYPGYTQIVSLFLILKKIGTQEHLCDQFRIGSTKSQSLIAIGIQLLEQRVNVGEDVLTREAKKTKGKEAVLFTVS